MNTDDRQEAKRRAAVEAGEMLPTAEDVERVESAVARHAGQTDPTSGEKLDRLLARNALTSLGKSHPANMSRAERRRRGYRGALPETSADLKRKTNEL